MTSRKQRETTAVKNTDYAVGLAERRDNNDAFGISRGKRLIEVLLLIAGGMIMTAAFPPLNLTGIAWFGLVPLFLMTMNKSPAAACVCGFLWGWGFFLTAFFWLREIEWFIPWLSAPVLALFPACWAAAIPYFKRGLLIPNDIRLKGFAAESQYCRRRYHLEIFLIITLAVWWCIGEWIRGWIGTGLPWNFLSATQWRNLPLIQIAEITGVYGISFLIVTVNISIASFLSGLPVAIESGKWKKQLLPAATVILTVLAVCAWGSGRRDFWIAPPEKGIGFAAAVLQGDISQRRHATEEQAREAMEKYLRLSEKAASRGPDVIIWPETAIPYPLRSAAPFSIRYLAELREMIARHGIPYLVGSIDFERLPPGASRPPGITNAALLFGSDAVLLDKFDKVHLVPFGEFVPFRNLLPEFIVNRIDMGRDLTPGVSFEPLEIIPGVFAGINICFEDVFPYVARHGALAGANLLAVITNDAWYPRSSEPEQHLANSIFRTVETRLPMIRCGNNSSSCLINPAGKIIDAVFMKESGGRMVPDVVRRGEGIAVFRTTVRANPEPTFYTLYGDVFIACCWMVFMFAAAAVLWKWRRRVIVLRRKFTDYERF